MPATKHTALILSASVWAQFEKDQPRPGQELDEWIERTAIELGATSNQVRKVVARTAASMLTAVSDRMQSRAEVIAEAMGADLVSALEMLREAFHATKRRVLFHRSGLPRLIDEDVKKGPGYVESNLLAVDTPDWFARLQAIRMVMEIYGARAPQQVEVHSESVTLDLTPHDAMAELKRISEEIPRLKQALTEAAKRPEGAARDGGQVKGQAGAKRPPLLAN